MSVLLPTSLAVRPDTMRWPPWERRAATLVSVSPLCVVLNRVFTVGVALDGVVGSGCAAFAAQESRLPSLAGS